MAYPLFHPARRGSLPMAITGADFAREFPAEGDTVEFKSGISSRQLQETVVERGWRSRPGRGWR
jgi:hypothetical protein